MHRVGKTPVISETDSGAAEPSRGRWRIRLAALVLALTLCACPGATAQEVDPAPHAAANAASPPEGGDEFTDSLDEQTAQRVESLIAALGHGDYRSRERATLALIGIGVPAFARLRDAYRRSGDLEVTLRIERIVHVAYMDYHVYASKGFLGVSMRPYGLGQDAGVPIPPGTSAVTLTEITEETAAHDAGLLAGDVIVAVDGEPFVGTGANVVEQFSAIVGAHRPGEDIVLALHRGAEREEISVTLGRCPPGLARSGRVRSIAEAVPVVQQRFEAWWEEYFHRDGAEERGAPTDGAQRRRSDPQIRP